MVQGCSTVKFPFLTVKLPIFIDCLFAVYPAHREVATATSCIATLPSTISGSVAEKLR